MPDQPMSEPKPLTSSAARNLSLPDDAMLADTGPVMESNFAELAALFAANNGSGYSADLALDVVLNEIVEQACLTTGASGAAIVLGRDGEMVCRASSGSIAPELGARLDGGSSITSECLRTHQVQFCDDAQSDPRADMEASRRLGVRSVIVLPLFRDAELVGVFEIFSTRSSAFGERDQRTLEALALRVIKNLESVDQPPSFVHEAPPVAQPMVTQPIISPESTEMVPQSTEAHFGESNDRADSRAVEAVTWALGLTVLACAILLGTLAGERLGWMRGGERGRAAKAMSAAGRKAQAQFSQGRPPAAGRVSAAPLSSASVVEPDVINPSVQSSGSPKPGTQHSSPPIGGLLVYEKGKEVFRMPPSQGETDVPNRPGASGVQLAASVDQESTVELSSAAAEDSLVHRVEPEYPEEARQKQIQGPVVLDIHINQDGGVQELKLVSGPALLAQAAMDAVKQWRFKPRKVNGHPAEMQTKITLNFKLPR